VTILYKHFNEFPVYPGHPVTLALEIMLTYERNLGEAFAPSIDKDGQPLGWCKALGDVNISGAGGCVWNGVDLLRKIQSGQMSPGEAVEWGMKVWKDRTLVGGDHRKAYQEGHEQAERMVWPLLDQIYRAMAEGKFDVQG